MSPFFGFPSGLLTDLLSPASLLGLHAPRGSGRGGYRIEVTTEGQAVVISVMAPSDALMSGRVSHRLDRDVEIHQDSRSLSVTLSGAPFVTYKVEPVTKGHVSIVLDLRHSKLVVPKARGNFHWIEVTIQLPKTAMWHLASPVAAVLPVVTLNQAVDGILHAAVEQAGRRLQRKERELAAAAASAAPSPDPPPVVRKKAVSKNRQPKKRRAMKADRKKPKR